jgi:hypothetical protein
MVWDEHDERNKETLESLFATFDTWKANLSEIDFASEPFKMHLMSLGTLLLNLKDQTNRLLYLAQSAPPYESEDVAQRLDGTTAKLLSVYDAAAHFADGYNAEERRLVVAFMKATLAEVDRIGSEIRALAERYFTARFP